MMKTATPSDQAAPAPPPHGRIAALRASLRMNQAEFAVAIGCSSKGRVSEMERGLAQPTVAQALRLEELSGGRIDAAALNADVAAARSKPGWSQAGADIGGAAIAPDAARDPALERVIVCDVCDRRIDAPIPNVCTFVDCPHAQRHANMGIVA